MTIDQRHQVCKHINDFNWQHFNSCIAKNMIIHYERKREQLN